MAPSDADVRAFLDAIPDARRRTEAHTLADLMAGVTGERPRLWAGSIVGFGSYHYRYASGTEGDAPLGAFASRAKEHVLYLGEEARDPGDVAALGPHREGKACVYVRRLDDVDLSALRRLVDRSAAERRSADKRR
jgi:Domain of unknown function (DU1801)